MIRVRVMYDDSDEREEALRVVRKIMRALSTDYRVSSNMKIYRNRRNSGGRVYIVVKKATDR